MAYYVFDKYPPYPKVRVEESRKEEKVVFAKRHNISPRKSLVRPRRAKEYLVKVKGKSFLVYHFENLNLYVKVKPKYIPEDNYQPDYTELCKIDGKVFEAIKKAFEVIPC